MKFLKILVLAVVFWGCGTNATAKGGGGIILPAYFYNQEIWDEVINAPGETGFLVIVNPDSGPGLREDPHYTSIIGALKESGKKPVGYVYTKWGERELNETKADIDKWIKFYPLIQGFFIDEAASGADKISYYETLYEYIKSKGDYFIVLNPGTRCDSLYYNIADTIVVYEGEVGSFNPAVCSDNPEKDSVIIYGADEDEMKKVINAGCGYFYVTDDDGSNPYDSLPGYFYEEIEELK
ncbi:spherulation-specific family 4 protein [Nautilia sp.]